MSRGFSRGGGDRGGRGGFRGGGGRGGGRGGFQQRDFGPPESVLEIGSFLHPVESEMLCGLTQPTRIPYFNAPIYLQNKTQIGKIDEILGPINEVYFTVKMDQGMMATSFKKDDKVYIGGDKLLPIERFLPKPAIKGAPKEKKKGGAAGARGRGRGGPPGRGGRGFSRGGAGGRGGFGGGFGGDRGGRGGSRGGFSSRGGGGFSRGGSRGGFSSRGRGQ